MFFIPGVRKPTWISQNILYFETEAVNSRGRSPRRHVDGLILVWRALRGADVDAPASAVGRPWRHQMATVLQRNAPTCKQEAPPSLRRSLQLFGGKIPSHNPSLSSPASLMRISCVHAHSSHWLKQTKTKTKTKTKNHFLFFPEQNHHTLTHSVVTLLE